MILTMRTMALLALPALVAAKEHHCAAKGVDTGIRECTGNADGSNTKCPLELRMRCDNMYDYNLFGTGGVPCGAEDAPDCPAGVEPIAFPNAHHYPPEALTAVRKRIQQDLKEGSASTDSSYALLPLSEQMLYVKEDTYLNITFLYEGACYENSLGFATFSDQSPHVPNGNPREITLKDRQALLEDELDLTVIFPNMDEFFCNRDWKREGRLFSGTTMKLIPDFRSDASDLVFKSGTFLSFFLMANGWNKGYNKGSNNKYTRPAEELIWSTPELNDPDMKFHTRNGVTDVRQHTFMFDGFSDIKATVDGVEQTFDFSDETFVCFEDIRRHKGGDQDFEDVCFFISGTHLVGKDPPPTPGAGAIKRPALGGPGGFTLNANTCEAGILSNCGNVCCAAGCGACGGCGCSQLPGGADMCCPNAIVFNGMPCMKSDDVGCVVDMDMVCPTPSVRSGCGGHH